MSNDPFVTFKERQREMWSTFAPTATFTTPVAAQLVRFAGVSRAAHAVGRRGGYRRALKREVRVPGI